MGNCSAASDDSSFYDHFRQLGTSHDCRCCGKLRIAGILILYVRQYLLGVFFSNAEQNIEYFSCESSDNGKSLLSKTCLSAFYSFVRTDFFWHPARDVCGFLAVLYHQGRDKHSDNSNAPFGSASDLTDDYPVSWLWHYHSFSDYEISRSGNAGLFRPTALAIWFTNCLWPYPGSGTRIADLYAESHDPCCNNISLCHVWIWLFQSPLLSHRLGNKSGGILYWTGSIQPD